MLSNITPKPKTVRWQRWLILSIYLHVDMHNCIIWDNWCWQEKHSVLWISSVNFCFSWASSRTLLMASLLSRWWSLTMLQTLSRCTAGAVTGELGYSVNQLKFKERWSFSLCFLVAVARSGGSCVRRGRATVTLMTRSVGGWYSANKNIQCLWVQCAGLLECGQNNCAAKSGGYWDEEVHTESLCPMF